MNYLANTFSRGENYLTANMDGRSQCQLFLPEQKSVLTYDFLMVRYEIHFSFEGALLLLFPIQTKSKYQFQEGQ